MFEDGSVSEAPPITDNHAVTVSWPPKMLISDFSLILRLGGRGVVQLTDRQSVKRLA